MNFFDKLLYAIERNQSLLYAGLDPDPESLPERYHTGTGTNSLLTGLRDWLQDSITQTADFVCAYKLTLGFYQALGVPGLELLQQTLASIPALIPVILDAKHSDLNTSTVFARTVFQEWGVDACTLSPYAGLDQVAPFLVYPGKAVFVLCATANSSAAELQEYPGQELPFYLHLVQAAKTWGTPEQLGLEVGAATPEILARIRGEVPERPILLEGGWRDDRDLAKILGAGLNAYGDGLLLPAPSHLLASEQPAEELRALRDTINHQRFQVMQGSPTCDLWLPDVCFLQHSAHRDLILQLFDIGCITFGEHVQASGAIFPYYIDLRKIISQPQIFHQILSAYAGILQHLEFDRIAGIPYGSLPTATGLALRLKRPMIFPRKEAKAYGSGRVIEGNFHPGEKIVVVDDILISGKSAMEGAEKLQSAGLKVEDIVVFIDHEKGVKDRLQEKGYRAHSVLGISEIAETLHQAGRIDSEQFKMFADAH
ncbi:bifunctional orotidine-5'-phosphate decarboxylase/orotate phosphoribosyltransferase [Microcoleus sp. FACHB-68]|uniref:bifunctional orotidine-5'-phosphate decarboxylase/orotate phosphoribosyltransferase n=1 Tax=Microcoleus sp. FACHB-68 TaxID=2692826 RepID=UPI001686F7B1|nr:bifunctional orotidine-5'-phosphate decarboxylase/orotate phosphoribosyltransferase [Microcoleus sp. FACHB-68]MBD1937499.1 bifunctional orotidine-5'-phosphate decarboxylase/orotate phosphoribosyltransferase [Microcoleus sp. FACHB-68]